MHPQDKMISSELFSQIIHDIHGVTRDILFFMNPQDKTGHFNARLEEVLGYRPEEFFRRELFFESIYFADKPRIEAWMAIDRQPNGPPESIEHRILTRRGDIRWVRTTLQAIRPGWLDHILLLGTIADIDEEKRFKNRLREKTYRDPLTGLPNRTMLEYKLQAYMESVQRNKKTLAFITLDLDNFKIINENHGFGFGDNILKQIGDVLLAELPVDTAVFRVGGDEFVLIIKNLDSRADLEQIMQNIMNSLSSIDADGETVPVMASAGIAIYPDDCRTCDDIQSNAMIALKKAKNQHAVQWCYFNPAFRVAQQHRADLEKRLRHAIEKKEFHLVYQAQVDAESCRICGLEALIRWQDPKHGLISPLDFIPLAETCGLMIPIGAFVLEAACNQLVDWQAQGIPVVPVAVNISTTQILDPHFFANLRRTLAKTGLDPRLLELEITESLFLESSQSVQDLLARIREMGIRIALDDFGSGYSSLTYLKNFRLDRLKIDRTFIHDMKHHSVETAITGTIVALAHILDLEVVAEGIENQEQHDFLRQVGCNTLQGFYFHRPETANKVSRLLQTGWITGGPHG